MKTALAKQRLNVVQQQIAAGREFKVTFGTFSFFYVCHATLGL